MLSLSLTAFAGEVVKVGDINSPVQVTVLQSSEDRVLVKFEVGSFAKNAVEINGKQYYSITVGKDHYVSPKGTPVLPRVSRSVIISDTGSVELTVVSSEFKEFTDVPVAPSKGNLLRTINPDEVPYEFGPVYTSGEWYPETLASVREPYILRDHRGTVIDVNAFQYNAARDTLRVYTSVVVEVRKADGRSANELIRSRAPETLSKDFDLIYNSRFINYNEYKTGSRYNPVPENGGMLIICNDAWMANMAPFVTHKQKSLSKVEIVGVSTIGNDTTKIKAYIQDYYNTNKNSYVLLVGDSAQVATPTASGGSSDPSYAKVAGGDNYPDIIVGRFSAETSAQVDTQVNKVINYENGSEESWWSTPLGIGSNQGQGQGHNGGEMDRVHINKLLNKMGVTGDATATGGDLPNHTVHDNSTYPTADDVFPKLNPGCNVIVYCGHGSTTSWGTTGFSNSDIAKLANGNKLPIIFSVACVNGQFAGYTCFAEAWLRATNGGAIAMYASSINQSWLPPMDGEEECVDLLAAGNTHTFGGLAYNGSCKMIDINGSGGVSMYDTWHIFGDPSLKVNFKKH